jgi:hypothetical protein
MDDSKRFQRLAGVTCLLAGACYIGSVAMMAAAVNFNLSLDAFSGTMIASGPRGAELLRWGLLLDGLGSYLLLAPLALYLWAWLKPENPSLANLYTLCGLAYMLVGAIGAFALAAALPPLPLPTGRLRRRSARPCRSCSTRSLTPFTSACGILWK